jgi:hypothetical protein
MFGKFSTADATNAGDVEEEMFASSEKLKKTGHDLRGLVQRVRSLSSGTFTSTEST